MEKQACHRSSAYSKGDGDSLMLMEFRKCSESEAEVEATTRAARCLVWLMLGCMLMTAALASMAVVLLQPRARLGGGGSAAPRVLVCYYNTPGDARDLQPGDVPAELCTHINVAFARVRNCSVHLEPAQLRALGQLARLRRADPDLKLLVSVGGAGADGFQEMVHDHAARKLFIRSIKSLLRNYTLDGIDLDWEFPAGPKQRQHFSQLLREIRAEYIREKRNYLLTVAVVAQEIMAETAYDFSELNLYTDFVNIMTYDYHFYTKMTPFTGFNSPLYAEPEQHLFLATLNVNHTIHMYLAKGLTPDKLVVGIPTYGHSFRLVNPDNAAPGAPAAGPGALGAGGFVSYADVCRFLRRPGAARARDAAAGVPYAHGGGDWLSYDDEPSAALKAAFAARLGLRGAMVYSLNADDGAAVCAPRRFPLVTAVHRALGLHLRSGGEPRRADDR